MLVALAFINIKTCDLFVVAVKISLKRLCRAAARGVGLIAQRCPYMTGKVNIISQNEILTGVGLAACIDILDKQCKLLRRADLIGIVLSTVTAGKCVCGIFRPTPLRHVICQSSHWQAGHNHADAKHKSEYLMF